uniref:Uncharacterized protein n=1 Tax=Anguilla anguilla TaxID=7936 RepID=A0A0E9XU15_ANGAN
MKKYMSYSIAQTTNYLTLKVFEPKKSYPKDKCILQNYDYSKSIIQTSLYKNDQKIICP